MTPEPKFSLRIFTVWLILALITGISWGYISTLLVSLLTN